MPRLLPLAIAWSALGQVAAVTIVATVSISALMSLSNWFLTTPADQEHVTRPRMVIGFILLGIMGLIVLFGLYLMIPYFHPKK